MPKFNFNAKRVFLTYPRCTLEKEELLEWAKTISEPLTFHIAKELHEDGTPHLHALLQWDTKVHTTNERFFDCKGYHPNVKKVNNAASLKNHVQYVKKYGDFITNEVEVLGKRALLFKELINEGLNPEFVRRNPEIMQFNLGNLKSWLHLVRPHSVALKQLPKKRHIWLSGGRNSGKTTFLRAYQLLFESVGQVPYNDDWGLVPYNCDFIFADEFKGQISIQSLNRLCDGGGHFNVKGGSIILGQPLVFICSNYGIDACYGKVSDEIRETVRARFREFDSDVDGDRPKFPMWEL